MPASFPTFIELAERLEARFRANRNAVLTPATALRAATAFRALARQPNRDEIAKMVCGRLTPCEERCVSCLTKANVISRYLEGDPDTPGAPVYAKSKWSIPEEPKKSSPADVEAGKG
jgi:hypothetical protein